MGRRTIARLLFPVLLLAACTADEPPAPRPAATPQPAITDEAPTTPSGLRVAVVLPPGDDEHGSVPPSALRNLSRVPLDDRVNEVRPLVPDDDAFVADLAAVALDRGADVVCVLGPAGLRTVVPLAERHPDRRFCALPARGDETPPNVTVVDVRFEEVGKAIGVTAVAQADGRPVAVVLGTDRVGAGWLGDGLELALDGVDGASAVTLTASREEVDAAVGRAIDDEAAVLVIDVGHGAADAIDRAVAAGMTVMAPTSALAAERARTSTALTWRVRWDRALRAVLDDHADGLQGRQLSVGLAEGVVVVEAGPALSAPARRGLERVSATLGTPAREPEEPAPDR